MKSTKRKFDSNAYDEDSDDELPDYWKLLKGNDDELEANGKEVVVVNDSDEDIEQSGILTPRRSCPKVIKQRRWQGKVRFCRSAVCYHGGRNRKKLMALTGISQGTGCVSTHKTMEATKNSSASSIHPITSESVHNETVMKFEAINMVTQREWFSNMHSSSGVSYHRCEQIQNKNSCNEESD